MKHSRLLSIVAIAVGVVLAFTGGLAQAQTGGLPPSTTTTPVPEGGDVLGPEAPADTNDYIPIQGRLTDASGNPLNGTYTLHFRTYDVLSGGTALCSSTRTVTIVGGLFSSDLIGCGADNDGRSLYVGIAVGADAEMTPRQSIRSVPYALSLRPGATISGTLDGEPVLHIENWGTSGRGLRAYAMDTTSVNYGMVGASRSSTGYGGYFYNSGGGVGLWTWSTGVSHPALFGCVDATSGGCDAGTNPAGVRGASSQGDGVMGITDHATYRGVYAENTGGGIALVAYNDAADATNHNKPTVYMLQTNSTGDFVVGAGAYMGTRYWRVDRTGKGFFNGGTQASGADFAEQIAVQGDEQDYEPGDVLVISTQTDRAVELSATPFATTVIGVYSTQPAMLAGAPDQDDPLSGIPVAITGIVPCKVSAENGAIRRGDLLVTASLPGYAMRAGSNPPQGTVLGKAMGELDTGAGVIQILVTLQ